MAELHMGGVPGIGRSSPGSGVRVIASANAATRAKAVGAQAPASRCVVQAGPGHSHLPARGSPCAGAAASPSGMGCSSLLPRSGASSSVGPLGGARRRRAVPVGRGRGGLAVQAELAGQYEESFADVEKQLFDYFTFKAVNTVLTQLLEMNPAQYSFLYNFVVNNKVRDSKLFIRSLVQERQELAERIMVTRLHLYSKWAKKYDHAAMHAAIKDQNLELLRERLMETVVFQAEDSEGQGKGSTAS